MADPEKRTTVRIVYGPSTEAHRTGKVGEETLEHPAGGEILTRRQINEAVERELRERAKTS